MGVRSEKEPIDAAASAGRTLALAWNPAAVAAGTADPRSVRGARYNAQYRCTLASIARDPAPDHAHFAGRMTLADVQRRAIGSIEDLLLASAGQEAPGTSARQ